MSQPNYYKTGNFLAYDKEGFMYVIDSYSDSNNPNSEKQYQTNNGNEVIKLDDNSYKITGIGYIVYTDKLAPRY